MSAQTPYNPDADGNGLIGVSDLTSFLSLYGSSFSTGFIVDDAITIVGSPEQEGASVYYEAPSNVNPLVYVLDGTSPSIAANADQTFQFEADPVNGTTIHLLSKMTSAAYGNLLIQQTSTGTYWNVDLCCQNNQVNRMSSMVFWNGEWYVER
jgi:hypothetical protein